MVSPFKFLDAHITQDLTWTRNITALVKKAQQRLYFLRTLEKNGLLLSFYHGSIENVITCGMLVWFGSCTVADRNALQRGITSAPEITGTHLPTLSPSGL